MRTGEVAVVKDKGAEDVPEGQEKGVEGQGKEDFVIGI